MGGKSSRNKGIRGEWLVRDELIRLGYKATRVPQVGFGSMAKGNDVIAEKDGKCYTFEVKWRENKFKSLYTWFFSYNKDSTIRVAYENSLIAISTDFESLTNSYRDLFFNCDEPSSKYVKRLLKYKKDWIGKADFLVLKSSRNKPLFIKYWDKP